MIAMGWIAYYIVIILLFVTLVFWGLPRLVEWQVNCTPHTAAGHAKRFELCL